MLLQALKMVTIVLPLSFFSGVSYKGTRREEPRSVLKTSGIEYKLLLVTSVKGHIGKESDAFEH